MPIHVVLGKFTEQAIRNITQLRQEAQENMQHAQQLGIKVHGFYL